MNSCQFLQIFVRLIYAILQVFFKKWLKMFAEVLVLLKYVDLRIFGNQYL
jgi:hypothetical protein